MSMKRWTGLAVCLFLGAMAMVLQASAANAPAITVGRVYTIEGDLLRFVPEEKDWVPMVKDAPFGTEDVLFSGNQGMAEMIVPNGTRIRIGNNTQIQFIALDTDLSETDIASGVARFYNKSSRSVIKTTSPFGYVLAYPGTVFDFYVGDNSVEVVAVKGRVSFVHSATGAKYDVAVGSPSILADQQQVSSGEGTIDPDWDRWNKAREKFWAAKARVRGRSVEYLPPGLQDEAYVLEENGRWERVPYEGAARWFWRPRVAVGWSPYTVGRWTDWYGDQTWIPAESFGYVTHHYGNWVYLGNYWYWAPPVVSVQSGSPFLDVGYYWYPGRVSWIHSGAYVGWVPLAPRETYYSYHHWGGPHDVVVTKSNFGQININPRNYAYANRAILVNQNDFYRVNNYRDVRVTNINRTAILNDYRAAPVVNNTVIKNFTTDRQRYNYTNVKVDEKPHNAVLNRIQQNETIIHEGRKEKASLLQERVKAIPEGRVNREARIEAPRATNYIVPAGEVNRPKSEMRLQQKEIRSRGEGTVGARPGVPAKPEQQPAARPERVAPARPSPPEQPGQPARPERVSPAKPAPPERVAPARPSPPEQPGQAGKTGTSEPRQTCSAGAGGAGQTESAGAARSSRKTGTGESGQTCSAGAARGPAGARGAGQTESTGAARSSRKTGTGESGQTCSASEQPAARPERVAPARPSPPEQPGQAARPERVSPAKPAPPQQPAARPERVAPTKPSPPEQPGQAARPERVSPAKPAPPQQPAARPERVAPAKPSPPEQPGQAAEPDRTKKQKEPQEQREDQPEQREKKR